MRRPETLTERHRAARSLGRQRPWLALIALVATGGCASTEPPESSLPGTAVVADSSLAERVAETTANTEVPEAMPPIEGQRTLPEPDATSGAGTLLIYTAITGHQPFDNGSEQTDHWSLGRQSLAGSALDREIQEELRRRQEALDGLQPENSGQASIDSLITGSSIAERANPRITPHAPELPVPEPRPPLEPITIMAGSWDNAETLEVQRGVVDENGDGKPDAILFFTPDGTALLRSEQDLSRDGILDTFMTYANGELVRRYRDTNADSKTDVWEEYAGGRMTTRTIDRNRDGVVDSFFEYAGDTLVEERHDLDDDGQVDQRIRYENLFRAASEEDRDRDGHIDTWTTYGVSRGNEVVARIERASKGAGGQTSSRITRRPVESPFSPRARRIKTATVSSTSPRTTKTASSCDAKPTKPNSTPSSKPRKLRGRV